MGAWVNARSARERLRNGILVSDLLRKEEENGTPLSRQGVTVARLRDPGVDFR
jgi:hypothetical protein